MSPTPVRRLASPLTQLRPHYDAIVVGSGYGASVFALRLAEAGRSVCVLERGKEWLPGEFPRTAAGFARQVNAQLPKASLGPASGLFRFHVGEGVTVAQGCGLGGGSLVNANVAVRPDARVFGDPRWPAAFRADVSGRLEQGYARAEALLRPTPYAGAPLKKLQALDRAAQALGAEATAVPLTVSFEDGQSAAGVEVRACTLCGNCLSGCNHGAKGTLTTSYLALAHRFGAQLFCEVEVRRVERRGDRWVVHHAPHGLGREKFRAPEAFVTADTVVLAGGALGSTEILLRSRAAGLSLSARVGQGFSGNGCTLGFGHNSDAEVNAVGSPEAAPSTPVGPAITGMIDLRPGKPLAQGMVIQDSVIPGPLGAALGGVLALTPGARGGGGAFAQLSRAARTLLRMTVGPHRGTLRRTQAWAVTAYDDAGGRLSLEGDRLKLRWANAGTQPSVLAAHEALAKGSRALHAEYIPNPSWQALPSKPTLTPHPLGGCAMAEDASSGVVDHRGRVFRGERGTDVHEGLYVCDASIIPCPLAANPLLTLTAVAERSAALLLEAAAERSRVARVASRRLNGSAPATVERDAPAAAAPRAAMPGPAPVGQRRNGGGFRFTERMRGHFVPAPGGARSRFDFVTTVEWPDLRALLEDPSTLARTMGTVSAPALCDGPLTIAEGQFQLFVPDDSDQRALRMFHRMQLRAADGRALYLEGFKLIRDDPGPDLWADTTTLFFSVSEGPGPGGRLLGRGQVQVSLGDLLRQITTLERPDAAHAVADLAARARFIGFFLGKLRGVYGGIVLPLVR